MGKTDKSINLTEETLSTQKKHMSPQKKSKQNKKYEKPTGIQADASLTNLPSVSLNAA